MPSPGVNDRGQQRPNGTGANDGAANGRSADDTATVDGDARLAARFAELRALIDEHSPTAAEHDLALRDLAELQATPRAPEAGRATPDNRDAGRGTPRNRDAGRGTPDDPEAGRGTPGPAGPDQARRRDALQRLARRMAAVAPAAAILADLARTLFPPDP